MAFHDIRFPAAISFESLGGPVRRTEIVTLANGYEERNTAWAHSRRRYDAGVGLRSLDDVAALMAFFEARGGQLHAFRWKDWSDFKSCLPSETTGPTDQTLGYGDGTTTTWPLIKRYVSGDFAYARPITKPVAHTVTVAVAAQPLDAGHDYTLNPDTGTITFTAAPAIGAEITAGYEFDVPVRFESDAIQMSVSSFRAGQIPSVPLIEVRL
ncbi:hypothetical protein BVG79_00926 [Ketogulonicigenium robustum]|uniref:DUF2460 domain-containing protein n=1 Tax=Ketogulonicigenium robustum TaxID=92947 RepID=A0A1W6NYF5_9RHOB|nr:DUF2460 domain-containing protein [Ketogulonicigenium robustum]ARO14278.1 hypothetical protein BVG79_00926 [Ketogulonicigenium robustum]